MDVCWDLRSGARQLARWLPRILLAVVLFFIAVDIAPEVDDGEGAPSEQTLQAVNGRLLGSNDAFISSNHSLLVTHVTQLIEGSNRWESCGPQMHSCDGPWQQKSCCCNQGYTFDSVAVACIRPFSLKTRRDLLFCSVFESDANIVKEGQERTSPTLSDLQDFDERALFEWVSKLFKEGDMEGHAALVALENHHVDGTSLLKLTRSKLDAEWNLMNIGLPQGAAEVLAQRIEALKIQKPRQLRRLATGTSGCDSDTGTSGASGCETPTQSETGQSHISHGQALQGCSKSSTGTRGCSSSHSGTKGCSKSAGASGTGAQGCSPKASKGCHAHAARGCDSGVQGCHSGVCGCQETSGLGDVWGLLVVFPLIILVAMQAILAPAILAAALLLPALLLVAAFVTGSFLVLLSAGCTAAVWTGFAMFYQTREEDASPLLGFGVE